LIIEVRPENKVHIKWVNIEMNTIESLRIQAEALSKSSLIGMKLEGAADEIEKLLYFVKGFMIADKHNHNEMYEAMKTDAENWLKKKKYD